MSELKRESVRELYRSMIDAIENPDGYSWLISKCGSQATLASVERQSLGIQSMTLNTFKKYANSVLDGGFEQVDKLRLGIKKKNKKPKGNTRNETKKNAAFYKEKLDEAERLRAILIRAYTDLNRICLDAVKNSPEYRYDLDRHNQLFSEYFSLTIVSDNE